jgi:hypothetical protein
LGASNYLDNIGKLNPLVVMLVTEAVRHPAQPTATAEPLGR